MSEWKKQAKKDIQGKFRKLKKDGDKFVFTMLGEPTIKTLSSSYDQNGKPLSQEQKKNVDGDTGLIIGAKTYNAYSFPVLDDGQEVTFDITQKGLLAIIMEEDDEESIVGRTFQFKQIGEKTTAQYRMKEVPSPEKQHSSFSEPEKEEGVDTVKDTSETKEGLSLEEFEIRAKTAPKPKKSSRSKAVLADGTEGAPLIDL